MCNNQFSPPIVNHMMKTLVLLFPSLNHLILDFFSNKIRPLVTKALYNPSI